MHLFNSLGSNYNFRYVLRTFLANDVSPNGKKLESFLNKKYGGKATLVYKGREAILLALKAANLPKDSCVAINGFTCYAVYEPIKKAGLKPKYLDTAPKSLHFSAAELARAVKANPKIKAVIIQNTLGTPVDIAPIQKICQQHGLVLVEDLAHSVGSVYAGGQKAGTVGDFTVLSFGRDKIIDAVSGGALIIRNPRYQGYKTPKLYKINQSRQIKDMFYPLLTWKVRKTYVFGLGKLLHALFTKLGLLQRGLGPQLKNPHFLPNWYADVALKQFENLAPNVEHRREIAKIYAKTLKQDLLIKDFVDKIESSSALRFPVLVKKRASLITYLKKQGIHVSDIWYDAPVAPAKFLKLTDYAGQCPEAEKIAMQIVNLPTHINVSKAAAKKIANEVNNWLAVNSKNQITNSKLKIGATDD